MRKIILVEDGELLEGGAITMIEKSPDCFVFDICEGDMWLGLGLGSYSEDYLRDLIAQDNRDRQDSYDSGLATGYNTGHSTFQLVED